MKKILSTERRMLAKAGLTALSLWAFTAGYTQTATNFTTYDCASVSHTLFTELDAGQVIVMCWVMPCASCIAPASADASAVQGFASSHPGRVKFYILDDTGGSSCNTLTSWQSTNSIISDATFQNAGNVIKMTDYGTAGMPKTVVLGGTTHTVFYNVNGTVTSSGLQTAITNALNATTGITEQGATLSSLNLYPNPADSRTRISYSLGAGSEVKIDIYNVVGEKVVNIFSGYQGQGEHAIAVDTQKLISGIYFMKFAGGNDEKTIKLSVSH